MVICLERGRKSAGEALDDFNEMMEMLKPYLPKTPKCEPRPRIEWKINNPYEVPLIPK